MAGKSNRGKNRKGSQTPANSSQLPVSSDASANDSPNVVDPVVPEPANDSSNAVEPVVPEANGVDTAGDSTSAVVPEVPETEAQETEPANSANPSRQGELHLYPVSVKTLGGEKLELQLNPGDSVMDVRQFLLDAPETCFFTCYDLLLHAKDGAVHHLEDYNEISEVADITTGDCSLEMVAAYYDDRSVRAHVHRTRELLSLSTLHASLSTSLALQHETTRSSVEGAQDSLKAELDGFCFMEDVTGSLNKLFSSSSSKENKCVESIVFSSFNPPPSHRRLVGDLIYLDVTTLEGRKFCVTGTTRMFYVNSSTGNSLDARPSKGSAEATTLIGLLQGISSKFKKAFREILEQKAAAHPFENVQSLLPPNSWLGSYPLPEHKRDAARAENALTLTYGSELIGMQRDWNEELQSCREFPHSSPQERILRDRALYKVTSDFVDAATAGAIGVINRCIPPINPTDPECFHMYVHNNIFFSFAVDADLEQLPHKNMQNTSSKYNVIRHDSNGKSLDKSSDGAADICNGVEANALKREDKNGVVDVATDVSAEIQLADSEQATYASANNDLKGTKAYQEADVPGLYNLAMAIIDYRGHRVVAQSVLPGILQGDKSDSLLYGSVDNGKKICWNEDFHLKVLEAAKCLHLKEHTVLDESGNPFKLAAPVECKGIVGSDDRHYLLDLMRVTPRDANYTGAGSRFCILRPELIRAFCQAEVSKKPTNKSTSEDNDCLAPETSDVSNSDVQSGNDSTAIIGSDIQDIEKETTGIPVEEVVSTSSEIETSEQISFNPNVFTEFKLAGSPDEIASDEDSVRKASSYLTNSVIPKFIQDLCTLEVSPMDGQTLTEALHAHGINVRYIGKVAEGTRHMPHLWDLCTNEVAVRAAKHLLKDVVRDTDDHELAPSVAHFFNCFFGNSPDISEKSSSGNLQRSSQKKDQGGHQKSVKGKHRSKNGSSVKKNSPRYMGISTEKLWSDITEFAKIKYQFDLPEDARMHVKKVSVIRNLCQKVGISLAARKYDLNEASPFQTLDILNLQPVVKHSIPVCSEARDLVENGKIQLAEGMLGEAYTAFSEAFSILQQVTGPMHREVANCCRYLAMVLYHAGDMGGAITQQHKELIINERCLGLDHPDTAHSYGNMALFYHGLNQTELALRHMARALLLLSLSSGPDHPDVAATFINVAMMYQDIGEMQTAVRYLDEALKKNERLLGKEHIQTAVCYHALAIAWNCKGAYKLSHQHEKKTYEILVKQLGEEDSRTRDSQNWMKTFKMRELQMNAQKQKGQTVDVRQANDILKGLQAAAAAGGSRSSAAPMNKALNAAMIGEAVPRGRGVDERRARAVASAKKKVDAKKQVTRPHGAPVQPVSQLVNIRSPGVVTESKDDGEVDKQRKETPVAGAEVSEQQDRAPVGLGKGLGPLDSKKQKAKSNVAS